MAEVKIEITAQDNASPTFKAVQASGSSAFNSLKSESQNMAAGMTTATSSAMTSMAAETKNYTESSKSLVTSLKEHWIAASVAIYAAWRVVNEAIDLAKMGAKAEQTEEAFRNVTRSYGEDADSLLQKMKEVSVGLISDSELMQRAAKGLQQGLSADQIVSVLEVARSAARTAGVDVVEAFDRITDATANQMTRGLKSMGIVIDQAKAHEDYAKKLGTVSTALTEQQQSQALANMVIEEGRRQMKAMGDITENASEKFQKHQTQLQELKKTIGKGLLVVFESFGALLYSVAAGGLYAAGALMKVNEVAAYLTGQFNKANKSSEIANTLFAAGAEVAKKAGNMWGQVGSALDGTSEKLKAEAENQKKATDAQKAAIMEDKKRSDTINSLSDLLDKAGLSSSEFASAMQGLKSENIDLMKDKFKETILSFIEFKNKAQDLNPALNETEKAIAGITLAVEKQKEEALKNEGPAFLNFLAPKIDETAAQQISYIYQKQLKDFTDMLNGIAIARQKAADEASLAAGNLFTVPKGALAEVDKWFSEMYYKYKNNSDMVTALANEAEAKRFEVMRDWQVKRLEKEKETTSQEISVLESWKSALEANYNEAIAKAKEYEATESALTQELAKRQQFLATGFGGSNQSLTDQVSGARENIT